MEAEKASVHHEGLANASVPEHVETSDSSEDDAVVDTRRSRRSRKVVDSSAAVLATGVQDITRLRA